MLERQCVDGSVQDTEVWADIAGYEGRYQVSSLGRVKSLARMRRGKNGGEVPLPEKIMRVTPKKATDRTRPYVEVKFRDGSPRNTPCKSFLVHRLVADAFIKRLEKGEQVDHINGIHSDNRVENLRVMHYVEHAKIHPRIVDGSLSRLGRSAAMSEHGAHKCARGIEVDGVAYPSVLAASNGTGISRAAMVYGADNSGVVKGHTVKWI